MTESLEIQGQKEYEYQGETFLLDDSKGCYIEVTYKNVVGYVGVYDRGTKDTPYIYSVGAGGVNNGRVASGNVERGSIQHVLDKLCGALTREQQSWEARNAFDQKEACETLHKFVENLS